MTPSPAPQQTTGRRAAQQEERAARIRLAARALLAEDGPRGLTIRAVAERAGYVAGSVYSYFPSKEALLAALVVDEMDGLVQALRTAPADLDIRADLALDTLRDQVPLLMAARRGDVPEATERALTGRIIAVLRALDAARGDRDEPAGTPASDTTANDRAYDTVALWSGLVGIALLSGCGRFASLDLEEDRVLASLLGRFGGASS